MTNNSNNNNNINNLNNFNINNYVNNIKNINDNNNYNDDDNNSNNNNNNNPFDRKPHRRNTIFRRIATALARHPPPNGESQRRLPTDYLKFFCLAKQVWVPASFLCLCHF